MMPAMSKKIPIIILTKDENRYLKLSVRSILNRTKANYHIFIVDNNSKSSDQKKALEELARKENITVLYNSRNEWILGFNLAIDCIQKDEQYDQDFYVLSDGDITVPLPKNNRCWLEYLLSKMKKNAHFGKIGLALDLGYIKERAEFEDTFKRESRYLCGPCSSGLIIAPVDTTLAIYRKDLFILPAFKMLPGHASLVKPYYYVARTTGHWQARHLGWRNYSTQDGSQLEDKIKCFTRYAAYIDPIVLNRLPKSIRLYFIIFKPIFKIKWAVIVLYFWIKYILEHFPRNFNELQSSVR